MEGQDTNVWIGRDYRKIRQLGKGGEGTVYLVQHCPTEQLRAAKLLKTDVPGRRLHELNMMKRLKHPALPQIFDAFEDQGQLWLILEYVRGKPLSGLTREELTPEVFFSAARQLTEVLAYLHTRKPPVLHLDIKPTNLLLRPDGHLMLIDFGAADFARPGLKLPVCYGTPGFAAPEQKISGADIDVRADFYGLGAALYYCLYGAAPGDKQMHKWRMPERLSGAGRCAAGLMTANRSVGRFLARCLQTDPEKRFQDDHALRSCLERAEKSYLHRKQLRRGAAALGFLALAVSFACRSMFADPRGPEQIRTEVSEETRREYRTLLQQADELGFLQAAACYESAVNLCPTDSGWCEGLLERIEDDYLFSMEEEEVLKRLFFTVLPGMSSTALELLSAHSVGFGTLAYRLGIDYWYFYEGAGGKSAAVRWFEQALSSCEDQQGEPETDPEEPEKEHAGAEDRPLWWLESARVHAKIGGYYQKLGKQDTEGRQQADYAVYWEDLIRLWDLDDPEAEMTAVKRAVAKEILSCFVMHSGDLYRAGIGLGQAAPVLEAMEEFIRENAEPEELREECRELYAAAVEAVKRAWTDEGDGRSGEEHADE